MERKQRVNGSLGSFLATFALAVVLLLPGCDAGTVSMIPYYRFVDPSLGSDAGGEPRPLPDFDRQTREAETRGAARIPIATINDDTRYVLRGYQRRTIVPLSPLAVPAAGKLTHTVEIGEAFPDADRLVIFSLLKVGDAGGIIPAVACAIEDTEGGRVVRVPLEVPGPVEESNGVVYVVAYQFVAGGLTSHRTPEVMIPPRATLEFSIGILQAAWSQGPVEFSVSACRADQCSRILVESLDPGRAQNQGWQGRRVSLKELSGQRRAFLFETRQERNSPNGFSLPVWANPTLYAESASLPGGRDIILVSLDTLRADRLSVYGYERETSPYLRREFSARGTVFENLIAAATHTGPSHMTMFTSLPPQVHDVHAPSSTLPGAILTVAQILRGYGYETGAATEDGAMRLSSGFGRGFNSFIENKSTETLSQEGHVHETLGAGERWLDQQKGKRFFLFLHTYQVHAPYVPPPAYENLLQPDEGGPSAGDTGGADAASLSLQYDREIRYVDDEFRSFIESLIQKGLLEDAIVVVTSDHGEEFFEHGSRGHGGALHREVLHVPLIFYGPGIPSGRRIRRPVRHVDLTPTLLELAGVPAPDQAQGESLVPLMRGLVPDLEEEPVPIFSSTWTAFGLRRLGARPPAFAVQLGHRKLLRYVTRRGYRYEYYDIAEDPGETTDLYRADSPEVRELANLIDDYIEAGRALQAKMTSRTSGTGSDEDEALDLDPRQEEKLRALGYLE